MSKSDLLAGMVGSPRHDPSCAGCRMCDPGSSKPENLVREDHGFARFHGAAFPGSDHDLYGVPGADSHDVDHGIWDGPGGTCREAWVDFKAWWTQGRSNPRGDVVALERFGGPNQREVTEWLSDRAAGRWPVKPVTACTCSLPGGRAACHIHAVPAEGTYRYRYAYYNPHTGAETPVAKPSAVTHTRVYCAVCNEEVPGGAAYGHVCKPSEGPLPPRPCPRCRRPLAEDALCLCGPRGAAEGGAPATASLSAGRCSTCGGIWDGLRRECQAQRCWRAREVRGM